MAVLKYPFTHRFKHLREISNPQERIGLNAALAQANARIGAVEKYISEDDCDAAFETFAKAFFDELPKTNKRQEFLRDEIVRDALETELKDLFQPRTKNAQ